MAKRTGKQAGELVAERAPCVHVDADGRCANPESNGQGQACMGCEDYQARGGDVSATEVPGAGELRLLPVGEIDASPDQVRRVEGTPELDAGIDELAASIAANGLASPLTVRWWQIDGPLGRSEGWRLIAGHRRLAACRRVGLVEVPCYVLAVDDRASAELTVIENLQRKDLSPIEEAAGVAALLRTGRSKEDVAAALGKSVRWVYRRASVCNLTAKWQALAQTFGLSAVFCEAVAKYPAEVQECIYHSFKGADCVPGDGEWRTTRLERGGAVEDVDRAAGHVLYRLSDRPWARRRKAWCEGCLRRSDRQADLFDAEPEDDEEETGARCLDPECWAGKLDQWIDEQREELKGKAGQLVEADENNYWHFRNSGTQVKTKQNTVPVLVVAGDCRGDVYWVPARSEDGDGELGVSAKPKGPTNKQKEMAAWLRAVEMIVGAAEEPEFAHDGGVTQVTHEALLVLLVTFGCSAGRFAPRGIDAWWSKNRLLAIEELLFEIDVDSLRAIYWRLVRQEILSALRFDTVSGLQAGKGVYVRAVELVRILGIPDGMIRAAQAGGGRRKRASDELEDDA